MLIVRLTDRTHGVPPGLAAGTVQEWYDDNGWGVVTADEFPDAIWVHFSAIQAEGYKSLTMVEGPLNQDGYRYRARAVRAFGSQATQVQDAHADS